MLFRVNCLLLVTDEYRKKPLDIYKLAVVLKISYYSYDFLRFTNRNALLHQYERKLPLYINR